MIHTLVELLQERAADHPDRTLYTLLADGERERERWTYAALDRRAREIAAVLQAADLAGARVLITGPTCGDYIAAFFGSLYAGAIAVPQSGGSHRRELAQLAAVAEDCEAAAVLSAGADAGRMERAVASRLPRGVRWLSVAACRAASAAWQPPALSSNDIAYLQYTSGSTSAPKGVTIRHAAVLANEESIRQVFGQDEHAIVVGWLPLYHDMGLVGTVLQPLYSHGRAVLFSPASFLQRPVRWLEAITRYRATTSGGPDFAYELCVQRIAAEDRARLNLRSWTVAFNGSEPVRARTLDDFAAAFGGCGFDAAAFLPCFGLAEATLLVSGGPRRSPIGRVEFDAPGSRPLVGCGAPAPGVTVEIVDPDTRARVAAGSIGEICVAGPNVASGYWRGGADRVFNVCLDRDGPAAFLRTGDLGCVRDGALFVTGRLKDVIIVRGRNVYAHDLEHAASHSHAAAGRAAVFAVPSDQGERIVVVQELRRGAAFDAGIAGAIRRALSEEHEVAVDDVVIVKAGTIPRTTSGKIRRIECRERFLAGTLARVAHEVAAAATVATTMTVDWSSVAAGAADERLGLAADFVRRLVARTLAIADGAVGDDQPLSNLGLDSMSAIELQTRLEEGSGVRLGTTPWLGEQTPLDLARRLLAATPSARDTQPRAIGEPTASADVPLSAGQRALWYVERVAVEPGIFNLPMAVRIRGPLDVDRLQQAFQTLVDRHGALRSRVIERQGSPVSLVDGTARFTLERHDIAGWRDQQVAEMLRERSIRPFGADDLPIRADLLRVAPSDAILLLIVHHRSADFWSLVVIVRELAASMTGSALPATPACDYADFVRWQSEVLAGPRGGALRHYWIESLGTLPPPVDLPSDRARPPVQTYRGGARPFHVPYATVDALAVAGRAEGATRFETFCTVFEVLLYRYTGAARFVHGTLANGRPDRAWHDTVGYFVNPIVLAAAIDREMTFVHLLRRVRDRTRAALQHQLPFPTLVETLGGRRDHSRPPLVSTMFTWQAAPGRLGRALAPFAAGMPGATIRIADATWESVALERPFADFDLMVTCAETDDGIRGTMQFNADLFDSGTIDDQADAFVRLADCFAANPASRVDVPLLDSAAIRIGPADAAVVEPVHRTFERACVARPHARAVVFEGREWTFDAVNRHANRLARRLVGAGVGPERRVGLLLPRCGEIPIAMLAVLKAGGAYVPLDPALPPRRLARMIADAGLAALVTLPARVAQIEAADAAIIDLDDCADCDATDLDVAVDPEHAAYLLYTSGSTGQPKGVLVTHRSVANAFAGMDRRIGCGSSDVLLAVSAITFDISVLELLWTLTRGASVVIVDAQTVIRTPPPASSTRRLDWSLFYFAQNAGARRADPYRLLMEGAAYGDAHQFTAVWTPERHFDPFGGPYPNPALTSAALAMTTRRIGLRAGSVVLPLHNPLRVAEEWSVVDNLSNGRVAVAFASGWHADDFVLAPGAYEDRKARTYDGIDIVRRLWRGEAVTVRGGTGTEVAVRIFPPPIQAELPVWVTAAGAVETFRAAGRIGANVLTHLLGQTVYEVARSIAAYRAARADAGRDPTTGVVTLMVHTFVGRDDDSVRRVVRRPMKQYLSGALGLIAKLARSTNAAFDPASLTDADRDALLDHAFERYFDEGSMLGSRRRCLAMADRLVESEVDEVACLIDFGVDDDVVLRALPALNDLREIRRPPRSEVDYGLAAQAVRYRPTLFQCTPSYLHVMLSDPASRAALAGFGTVLIGGEALPSPLLRRASAATAARLFSMYGPTETTIWSAVARLDSGHDAVPLGDAIVNTRLYVLDRAEQPVLPGGVGELWIAGSGLARGYDGRRALTAERFRPDPFGGRPGDRMYKTGDRVRIRGDGRCEWRGRFDDQVKIRGHRVEIGEIETALLGVDGVREAAVVADARPDSLELCAFVVLDAQRSDHELREMLGAILPSHMIPRTFAVLAALPRSASGKIDRGALKQLPRAAAEEHAPRLRSTAPRTAVQQRILDVWRVALGRDDIDLHDNFFDAGGHSLLMAQVHAELQASFGREWPLVRMLEYPSAGALARFLEQHPVSGEAAAEVRQRSASRRDALLRRQAAVPAVAGPTGS